MTTLGCDDDEGTDDPVDSGVPTNDTGTPTNDAAANADGAAAAGACNASDIAAVDVEQFGTAGNQTLSDATKYCAQMECASETDIPACMATCLSATADGKVSSACQQCYVATVLCAASNCMSDCASDPNGVACATCRCDNDCVGDWETCSGLTSETTCS
jgi:hypothetical protein